ncbi:MAG: helix-turn-helix domain-containing protein [Thermoanaerobaculia bacterium]
MTEKRGRGRPRREGADETILAAARALLEETGFAAFNVDVIAERTGIAKTTIYRRWPTKSALIAATIDTTTATDAEAILRETERLLSRLDGADLDLLRAVIEPRRERLFHAIGPEADQRIGALLTRFIVRG